MTLGNMRELGVAAAHCVVSQRRLPTQAWIDVSNYPAEAEVPWFRTHLFSWNAHA
jgi:hypothetical protein